MEDLYVMNISKASVYMLRKEDALHIHAMYNCLTEGNARSNSKKIPYMLGFYIKKRIVKDLSAIHYILLTDYMISLLLYFVVMSFSSCPLQSKTYIQTINSEIFKHNITDPSPIYQNGSHVRFRTQIQ